MADEAKRGVLTIEQVAEELSMGCPWCAACSARGSSAGSNRRTQTMESRSLGSSQAYRATAERVAVGEIPDEEPSQ